jgi:hypothetical protein
MCDKKPAEDSEHSCPWRTIVEQIEKLEPNDVTPSGQSHLSPAFREVRAKDVMIHIGNIVNGPLYGTDAFNNPLPTAAARGEE